MFIGWSQVTHRVVTEGVHRVVKGCSKGGQRLIVGWSQVVHRLIIGCSQVVQSAKRVKND